MNIMQQNKHLVFNSDVVPLGKAQEAQGMVHWDGLCDRSTWYPKCTKFSGFSEGAVTFTDIYWIQIINVHDMLCMPKNCWDGLCTTSPLFAKSVGSVKFTFGNSTVSPCFWPTLSLVPWCLVRLPIGLMFFHTWYMIVTFKYFCSQHNHGQKLYFYFQKGNDPPITYSLY